jgi:hypothetical protein
VPSSCSTWPDASTRAATSPVQSARRVPLDGTPPRPRRSASLRPDNCCGPRALDRSSARPRASGIAATAGEPMKRVSFNAAMTPAPKHTAASRRRLHSLSTQVPPCRSRGAAAGNGPGPTPRPSPVAAGYWGSPAALWHQGHKGQPMPRISRGGEETPQDRGGGLAPREGRVVAAARCATSISPVARTAASPPPGQRYNSRLLEGAHRLAPTLAEAAVPRDYVSIHKGGAR